MLSQVTLQRYIEKLDQVIASGDSSAAKELQEEIIAVFGSDIDGLKRGLTNYSFIGAVSNGRTGKTAIVADDLDFIKDARTLRSRLQVELEKTVDGQVGGEQIMRSTIFISHRTVDADIADMIKDFLVATGIPNDKVFCSSLPGNDVNEKISPEVKQHMRESIINILILSKDYYESAYCLNEAGVAWYLDDVVAIPIGLPEINENNMVGFLNNDYKLRRLDDLDDIAYIYDVTHEKLNTAQVKYGVATRETQKLKRRYTAYIRGEEEEVTDENGEDEYIADLVVGKDDVGNISVESAFLLVYAAAGNGQIMRTTTLGAPPQISASRKQFMADNSQRESARWQEALDRLISWGWVKSAGSKGVIFELTGTGYTKADWLKEGMRIDTDVEPLEELRHFEA